ncbi:tRNA pseudouridine(31) synthase [Candida viswanathii]|uniref:tRNA pseudouridine(31) synthase n=1 Tax=Candida viswanathii TaxID=5486 RepID=A0A367XRY0_9ASCO|nr:tRNA pseudouridine(31) synthase [Candida viswanathii]
MSKIIIENNYRKVLPYYVNLETFIKGRWQGRTLLDVFLSDFGESEQHLIDDIRSEKLYIIAHGNKPGMSATLKGVDSLVDRKLHPKDVICHSVHRHEPPIPYHGEIKTVYEDDELLVVDKPSGAPTHPTGNYYVNSVTEMVKQQFGLDAVWPCHRLDKVTSGVLILGKTLAAGSRILKLIQIHKDQTEKTYLARVVGNFPDGRHQYNCPIFAVNLNGYLVPGNADGIPLDSTTIFEKVAYSVSMDQSVVRCTPITGKFHQIRIHLRNLGFPIVNDLFYRGDSELVNRKLAIEEGLYDRLFEKYPEFRTFGTTIGDGEINLHLLDEKLRDKLDQLKRDHNVFLKQKKIHYCNECQREIFNVEYKLNHDIWLHALSFKYDKYEFVTDLPEWANI